VRNLLKLERWQKLEGILTVGQNSNLGVYHAKGSASFYEKSIQLMLEDGKFSRAAGYIRDVAEMYEKGMLGGDLSLLCSERDIVNAYKTFQRAAELFETDDVQNSARTCWLKVAELGALTVFNNF
jgi:hypothetical protein